MRQLGEMFPEALLSLWRFDLTVSPRHRKPGLGKLLDRLLARLAPLLGCEVKDLRLDHTWALENRPKRFKKGVHVDYYPPANDPEWLGYRPQGTQFAGSHDVKTRIRGDRGQLSDNALAKKERRRLRKLDPKRRKAKIAQPKNFKWPSRPFRRK
jgi:hypothetical protein